MSTPVISVRGLSKQYRIGERRPYGTLRDTIAAWPARVLGRLRPTRQPRREAGSDLIWALNDLSFDVPAGEMVGVIGRNGAGKSTLLKVLSRITEPTGGYADIHGRVGSLLEVGTGFHPELTGRENIYLNGAILGMRRTEIARQFDRIVGFAEVEKFIDTPVKFYSSGMYLRLAFAVAAHLDPEILLVDEVLAVGDAAFQKKCLGQMGKVAHEGRTILFVSHNMAAVRSLCTRAIFLEHGRIAFAGETEQAIHAYNHANAPPHQAQHHGTVTLADIRLDGRGCLTIAPGDPFTVSCQLHLRDTVEAYYLFCVVADGGGEEIAMAAADHRELAASAEAGCHHVEVRFPGMWLRTGVYSVYFKLIASAIGHGQTKFVSDVAMLDVLGDSNPGITKSYLAPRVKWSTGAVSNGDTCAPCC